jgi:hypothetical protein
VLISGRVENVNNFRIDYPDIHAASFVAMFIYIKAVFGDFLSFFTILFMASYGSWHWAKRVLSAYPQGFPNWLLWVMRIF